MIEISTEMQELFDQLVPSYGAAETVGGEVVRAFNRLGYRFLNDGDHVGIGPGNDTCNCAARFIVAKVPPAEEIIQGLWGEYSDQRYSDYLEELQDIIVWYLSADGREEMAQPNTEDIFDYWITADEHDIVSFDGRWEDEEEW